MSLEEQKNISETDVITDDNPFSSFEDVNDTTGKKKSKVEIFLTSTRGIITTLATTVILIVGVVLLVIFDPFAAPQTDVENQDPVVEDTTITLMDKSKKDTVVINQVDISNKDDSYSIRYNEEEDLFFLNGYEDILMSTDMSNLLQEYTSKLIAIDQVDDVNHLKDFGLDKPAATAKVTFTDKSTVTIQVGNVTPDETGYYVKTSVDDKVYIFDSDAALPFTYRRTAFVDVTMISAPTVLKNDTNGKPVLKEVSYSGKKYPTPFVIRRSYQSDSEEMTLFSYIISEPYQRGTNDAVSNQLGSFSGLYAEQAMVLHPTAAEKTALGFDDPLAVLNITMAVESSDEKDEKKIRYYNDTTSTVTIGSMNNDNYVVMVEGLDIIFIVEKGAFSALAERTYDNTVNPLLFAKNITEIGRISITLNGKTYDFQMKHFDTEDAEKSLKITVGDKIYPTTDFRELYTILMTLERYGTTTDKPDEESVLSIKMYHTDGSFYMGADYYSLDGSLCYVKTTEGEVFTTRWHYVTHFMEQVENYINGDKVLLLT